MNSALYGAVHPDVATGLNNLGLLYRSQGDLARAEESYGNALGMQRQLPRARSTRKWRAC